MEEEEEDETSNEEARRTRVRKVKVQDGGRGEEDIEH
jgi:hypothetical protein